MAEPMETESPVSQPQLAQHDSRLLDLAFAMDTTGSMSSYIRSACDNIRRIVEEIVAKEQSDLRLALVEYRDHPPQESSYVTQVHDFTASVSTMKGWLQASSAQGGGDLPEAVADALHDVLKLSWRPEATKICVLVSDAPPHGLQASGDTFPLGCPSGHDPMDVTRQLAEKGVTLYVAGCEPALVPYKEFFSALAYMTGGQYVPLSAASALTAVIIGGAREELSLEQWMDQVNQLVTQEVQQRGQQDVSHSELTARVMDRLTEAGASSMQLNVNHKNLPGASDTARNMSKCSSMEAVRSQWKPPQHTQALLHDLLGGPPGDFLGGPLGDSLPGGRGLRGGPPMPRARSARNATMTFAASSALSEPAPLFSPPPPPQASGPSTDTYATTKGEIQREQAHRMVQKSLMRNKIQLSKE